MERKGNFIQNDKSNMFISWQSYEGLQVTVHSFKEVCKFLLEQGISYILSERFCQDNLENYFGHRRDNPTVRYAGYNDNSIKSPYSVRPIARNVRANLHKFNTIDETPLYPNEKCKENNSL